MPFRTTKKGKIYQIGRWICKHPVIEYERDDGTIGYRQGKGTPYLNKEPRVVTVNGKREILRQRKVEDVTRYRHLGQGKKRRWITPRSPSEKIKVRPGMEIIWKRPPKKF